MVFATPKSKEEMYQILNEIFRYYRIRHDAYEDLQLEPLDIQKMQYEEVSEEQYLSRATAELKSKHLREIALRKDQINGELAVISGKLDSIDYTTNLRVDKINELYQESIKNVEVQAQKNGLISSSVVFKKSIDLEQEKNDKIAKIYADCDSEKLTLNAQREMLLQKLYSVDNYFLEIHQKEIEEKVLSLKEEQKEIKEKVFKYNNSVDEKTQRYQNQIIRNNAELKLQFMEIRSGDYTKSELIDMGYYADVVDCVRGYYDTLSGSVAYEDIAKEKKLAVYLDTYYEQLLYVYGLFA